MTDHLTLTAMLAATGAATKVGSGLFAAFGAWKWGWPAAGATVRFAQRMSTMPDHVTAIDAQLKVNGGGSFRDDIVRRLDRINDHLLLTTAFSRALAAQQTSPMFQTDGGGAYTFVNDAWVEMAGISSGDARGWGWVNAIHPDDRGRVVDEWTAAVDQTRAFYCDFRFRCVQTGDIQAVRCEAHQTPRGDSTVIGYVGIARVLSGKPGAS